METTSKAPAPRVALVTYALRCGGVSTFLFRLGRYLRNRGWSVALITTEEKGDWFELASEYGLPATHIPGDGLASPVSHTIQVGDYLADSEFDVILLNHSKPAQRSLGKLADDVVAIPIVHGDDREVYRVACSNRYAWNVLVAPGPKLHSVAQLEVPDRPVVMIPHGVAVPKREALRIEERVQAPLRIVFVGRLDDSHKGISFIRPILEACSGLGIEPFLRIAGVGPDVDKIEAMAGDLDLHGHVEWVGSLKPIDTYRLLLDSHILLMPSTREGFSLVTLEAQACGCVPVASQLPGVTDAIIEDRRTGYLIGRGEIERFAERIVALDKDRALWSKLSAAGHDSVAANFRLEEMGRAYEKLILDARGGRYPLRRPRKWRRPLDLSMIPGEGFLLDWLRRLGCWYRARGTR